jgi:predicted RNA-binding Zn-ribbon protein involved in translation (DUF1610 family)
MNKGFFIVVVSFSLSVGAFYALRAIEIKIADSLRGLYRDLNRLYFLSILIFAPTYLVVIDLAGNWSGRYLLFPPFSQAMLGFLIIITISLAFMRPIGKRTIWRPFVCSNCLKWVDVCRDWICPFCDQEHKEASIFGKCKKCKDTLSGYSCPHCGYDIDFAAPYNEKWLKEKRNA